MSAPQNDFPWFDYLYSLMPYRMKQGNAGFRQVLLKALIAQTISQYMYDALYFRHVRHPNSPNDVLNELGSEYGVIRAASESDDSFRERINNRWAVLPYYGQESSLINTLADVNYGTATIDSYLIGSDSDIAPPKAGNVIPRYPPSGEHPSQFNINLKVSSVLGTGTESNLLTDEQLGTIRGYVRQLKPVDWVCREIVIIYNPDELVYYGDGVTTYNGGETYFDPESENGFVIERHRGY